MAVAVVPLLTANASNLAVQKIYIKRGIGVGQKEHATLMKIVTGHGSSAT